MCTVIQGIPVKADPALSRETIHQIVSEIIRDWAWEGRSLGKIELHSNGQLVQVYSYEQPSVKLVPLKN